MQKWRKYEGGSQYFFSELGISECKQLYAMIISNEIDPLVYSIVDFNFECQNLIFSFSAIITTINHDEVWFKRPDGSKSKLYISQLQKGKYSIKHNHN